MMRSCAPIALGGRLTWNLARTAPLFQQSKHTKQARRMRVSAFETTCSQVCDFRHKHSRQSTDDSFQLMLQPSQQLTPHLS